MKSERCAIVAIHGIGCGTESERKGFSHNLAKLVYSDQPEKIEKSWHEAIWEGENENFDQVMRGISARLLQKDIFPPVLSMKGWRSRLMCAVAKLLCVAARGLYGKAVVDYLMVVLDALFDFVRYLDSDNGAKMRARVQADLEKWCDTHQEGIVVVAHSLGSLIAHDVLHKMAREGSSDRIKALVTIGSPIQWAFDLRKVDEKQEKDWISLGKIPWYNFYYREDPVAIDGEIDSNVFVDVKNTRLELPEKFVKLQTSWKAHCAYWEDESFADRVRAIIESNQL